MIKIKRIRIVQSWLIALLFLSGATIVAEEASRPIRLGIQMSFFERYPETNGVIWSDSVVINSLKKAGEKVEIVPLPAQRLPNALVAGQIDIYVGSLDAVEDQQDNIIHSHLPVVLVDFYIYYKDNNVWKPTWPPTSSLRSRRGLSAISAQVLRQMYGLNIEQSKTFVSSVQMVHAGRADYWLENHGGFLSLPDNLLRTKKEGFVLESLYTKPIFIIGKNTEEGRKILNDFDKHYLALLRNGNYANIFYENAADTDGHVSTTRTIKYIQEHHPILDISRQFEPVVDNIKPFKP
jgi:ABC-type amino acid transport substrate-binding protein